MRRAAATAAALALVALGGCMTTAGRVVDPLPPPPPTVAPSSTTVAPDFSQVPLRGVRGATTTTTAALGPGSATLKGTVEGPDGPVGSAVVRVERMVGDAVVAADVASQADGTWVLPDVKGGAYRARAWRVPDLAMVQPAFVFVGAKESFPLELKVERYSGPFATPAVAPDPPVVAAPVNLAVRVTQRSVDENGFVVGVPLAGARVQLASSTGGWLVGSANPTVSGLDGQARWEVRCRAAGTHPLALAVDGAAAPLPLAVPSCVDPAAEPAPPQPGPASSPARPPATPSTTTTTTVTTTTTTRR